MKLKLTVLGESGQSRHGKTLWKIRCYCGREKVVVAGNVKSGRTTSCGCGQAAGIRRKHMTHGMSKSGTYSTWNAMHQRCKKNADYTGRIKVCARWTGRGGFANFLADMGERPEGLTLERRRNHLDYCPENCCWATRAEQNCNTRANLVLTFNGRTQCAASWAREIGLEPKTLRARIYRGWSLERALTPLQGSGSCPSF